MARRCTRSSAGSPCWNGARNLFSSSSAERPCQEADVEIHAHGQAVIQLFFENTRLGTWCRQSRDARQVLEQGGLAVPAIAAQDDQSDPSLRDLLEERLLQLRFDVGVHGEVRIQTTGLAIAQREPG